MFLSTGFLIGNALAGTKYKVIVSDCHTVGNEVTSDTRVILQNIYYLLIERKYQNIEKEDGMAHSKNTYL